MRNFFGVSVSGLLVWFLSAPSSEAATRTVCARGCAYTDLQAAIDAAVFGDTILLRAGQTFVGHFVLRAKTGSEPSSFEATHRTRAFRLWANVSFE